MTEEIWKPISGYEEKYMVSNLGRVKSLKDSYGNYREKILKPGKVGSGYLVVRLYQNGKGKIVLVHRLVAETFLSNLSELPQVNHIDENKENNCVKNLEWCTSKYNTQYSKAKKIGCYKNGKLIKIYNVIRDVNKDGFYHQNVIKCCKGEYKSHLGFQWKYLED